MSSCPEIYMDYLIPVVIVAVTSFIAACICLGILIRTLSKNKP